jgi:DNA invertase Pin-like site-specific DNA recombinase
LDEALNYVRAGDTLVVWRLDRLGRSLKHLIETIQQLDTRHIGFKSLTENIDTTTSGGKLIFHIFGALMAARARGRKGGRPKVLTGKQLSIALDLYEKRHPIAEICRTLKISKATLYRSIKIGDRDQQYGSSR